MTTGMGPMLAGQEEIGYWLPESQVPTFLARHAPPEIEGFADNIHNIGGFTRFDGTLMLRSGMVYETTTIAGKPVVRPRPWDQILEGGFSLWDIIYNFGFGEAYAFAENIKLGREARLKECRDYAASIAKKYADQTKSLLETYVTNMAKAAAETAADAGTQKEWTLDGLALAYLGNFKNGINEADDTDPARRDTYLKDVTTDIITMTDNDPRKIPYKIAVDLARDSGTVRRISPRQYLRLVQKELHAQTANYIQ